MKQLAKYALFPQVAKQFGLPAPIPEYRFAPTRKWRFDFAWPEYKLALEVEGGVWIKGRHTSPSGFLKDMEKYNAAASAGWRIIRCLPSDCLSTDTMRLLQKAIYGP